MTGLQQPGKQHGPEDETGQPQGSAPVAAPQAYVPQRQPGNAGVQHPPGDDEEHVIDRAAPKYPTVRLGRVLFRHRADDVEVNRLTVTGGGLDFDGCVAFGNGAFPGETAVGVRVCRRAPRRLDLREMTGVEVGKLEDLAFPGAGRPGFGSVGKARRDGLKLDQPARGIELHEDRTVFTERRVVRGDDAAT